MATLSLFLLSCSKYLIFKLDHWQMMFVSHRVTLASPVRQTVTVLGSGRSAMINKVLYKLRAFNVRHQLLYLNQDPMRMKMALGMSRLQIFDM